MLDGASLLVVDDEAIMREILHSLLERQGCRIRLASSGQAGVDLARAGTFDAVLLDVMMPGMDGLEALDEITQLDEAPPVIMITAFGTSRNTREAFKRGAFDFIEKPFKNDDVLLVVRNAVAQQRLASENRVLRQNLRTQASRFSDIIGHSPRIRSVFDVIARAAPSRATILVSGESGTGKELVARSFHGNSPRQAGPFVTLDCTSIPESLIESELFGHERGAFTGATTRHVGAFERANGGTILLDEIGDMPVALQARLLRVLQEREIRRLGGSTAIPVDIRVITATNKDLESAVAAGEFREDLFYRIAAFPIVIPPLRDRREDIPLLARHFLEKHTAGAGKAAGGISTAAMRVLLQYQWPGNVRELENSIERAVLLETGPVLQAGSLPPTLSANSSARGAPAAPEAVLTLAEVERRALVRALEVAERNISQAARALGISRATLHRKLRKYDLSAE
jgi:two-component system response regulator AtoC